MAEDEADIDIAELVEKAETQAREEGFQKGYDKAREEFKELVRKRFNDAVKLYSADMEQAREKNLRTNFNVAFGSVEGVRYMAAPLLDLQYEDIQDVTEL